MPVLLTLINSLILKVNQLLATLIPVIAEQLAHFPEKNSENSDLPSERQSYQEVTIAKFSEDRKKLAIVRKKQEWEKR
jgi:hypothetical protein